MHRKLYEKMLEKECEGVTNIDGIKAIEKRLGYIYCYKYSNGEFRTVEGKLLEGLEEEITADSLTPTEQKIVSLVKQAKRNQTIADEIGISEGTVRTHLRSIFRKLKIKSRAELIIKEL